MKSVPLAAARGGHALLAMLLVLALSQEAVSQAPPSTPMAKVASQPAKRERPDPPPAVAQAQYTTPARPVQSTRPPARPNQPAAAPRPQSPHAPRAAAARQPVAQSAYYDAPSASPSYLGPMRGQMHPASRHGMIYQGEPEIVEPGVPMRSYVQGGGQFRPESDFTFSDGYVDGFEHGGCGECADCCGAPYGYGAPALHYLLPFADCCGLSNVFWLENFSINGGFHAFKSPVDLGRNGNFGLQTGFNWGLPAWPSKSIGFQIGYQALFSNFEGNTLYGPSDESRTQNVITAGIFHRPVCSPWQWGVVADWMKDDYYLNMSLAQLRVELSFLGPNNNEIGFTSSISTRDDTQLLFVEQNGQVLVNQTESWEAIDLYAFFWRRRFCLGAEGRLWGGFTGNGDGLFGGDYRVPLSPWLALQGSANYLGPRSDNRIERESWGLMLNLVLYPGQTAQHSTRSLWRPLFNVADPSNFIVGRRVVP